MFKIKPRWQAIVLTVAVIFMGLQSSALADEYRNFHRGTRTLGMGGAFTAVADDWNAIYFNPAGLAQVKGFGLGILNPQVEASENSVDLINDFNDIDSEDSDQVADLMRDYIGENNHIKVATDTYLGFKAGNVGIMISAVGRAEVDVRIRNPVNPIAEIDIIADYGFLAGAGMELPFLKGLMVGATLKGITRNSLVADYGAEVIADDIGDTIEDDMMEGTGISADLGLLYTTDALKLTTLNLGLTAQNVPEMDFGDAADSKTQFNAGVSMSQKILGLTFTEAVDIYDFTDNAADDESYEKKIHAGVEVALPVILSVRGGLNQGYYTAGATLDFKIIKLDVATYGEEMGVIGGQKEDRRFVGQVSMGWLW